MRRVGSMTARVTLFLSLAGCGGGGPGFSPPAGNTFSAAPQASRSEADSSPKFTDRARSETELADSAAPGRDPLPARHTPLPPSISASGQFRSGTLTAGSLDDQAKFDEFSTYLSNAMQHDRHEELPRFSIGRRAIVRVVNEQGEPLGDARVAISAADGRPLAGAGTRSVQGNPPAPWQMTTGADGRVVFLSGLDAPAGDSEFILSVTLADGGHPVTQRVSLDQTPWVVTLPQARRDLPRQLDLALVIDTTGSMGDELEYLKVEIDHIAAEVHERFPNVDQRFGLILYRDQGDAYVTRSFDFTASLPDFRRTLAAQTAAGGGDYPEAMHLALEQCTQLSWRGTGAARVVFLVADAPPHAQFAERTLAAVQKLRHAGVTVFPVASSGVKEQAEFIMRAVGFLTQGQYLFLTDHSGVGNPHAKPQAPSYSVEKLDQLIIRMIAEKLSGRAALPQDVIAVEESVPGPGASPAANGQPVQNVGEDQQPAASTTPPVPIDSPPPGTLLGALAELIAAPPHCDWWWDLAQTLLVVGAIVLLIVAERVLGV